MSPTLAVAVVMAKSLMQRFFIKAGRYLGEAFHEPGAMRIFQEELYNLKDPACASAFQVLTDAELGGLSTAQLRFSKDEGEPEGCLVFEGTFSAEIPKDAPSHVHRLGQAAFGTKITEGHYLWLGDYERQVASTMDYRLKGDGRTYGMYLKTDSYFEGVGVNEIWQAHVKTQRDIWQDVKVPVVDFVLTRDGYLTEETRVANMRRVVGLGFAVIGGRDVQEDGPFKLCVSEIQAGYDLDRSSGNED